MLTGTLLGERPGDYKEGEADGGSELLEWLVYVDVLDKIVWVDPESLLEKGEADVVESAAGWVVAAAPAARRSGRGPSGRRQPRSPSR